MLALLCIGVLARADCAPDANASAVKTQAAAALILGRRRRLRARDDAGLTICKLIRHVNAAVFTALLELRMAFDFGRGFPLYCICAAVCARILRTVY